MIPIYLVMKWRHAQNINKNMWEYADDLFGVINSAQTWINKKMTRRKHRNTAVNKPSEVKRTKSPSDTGRRRLKKCSASSVGRVRRTCTCLYNAVFSLLHCALSLAAQCIVVGPVCGGRSVFVCLWVCYHDNSKLRASILTKLGFVGKGSDISSWINFGRPAPAGRGSAAARNFLAAPYYSQCAVFASLWALFILFIVFIIRETNS